MNTALKLTVQVSVLATGLLTARAGEIGHYAPGVMNIRDFVVPEPGFYGVVYNYGYASDRLNDSSGNKINSVTIQPGPGPGVTLNIDVDLDVYALAPTFIWVSPWKILGAKYAAYITPTFGNTSIGASLTAETGSGRNSDESQFAMGDLLVQPVWLGWTKQCRCKFTGEGSSPRRGWPDRADVCAMERSAELPLFL